MATAYRLDGDDIVTAEFWTSPNLAATPLVPLAQKGVANGVSTLDGAGLVPAAQLPSYVDQILEFANLAAFPGTGVAGKIYVAIDTGLTYRWASSLYVAVGSLDGSPVPAWIYTSAGGAPGAGLFTANNIAIASTSHIILSHTVLGTASRNTWTQLPAGTKIVLTDSAQASSVFQLVDVSSSGGPQDIDLQVSFTSTAGTNWSGQYSVTTLTARQSAADVGLDQVNNTADADKPISTAQQAALDLKAPLSSPALTDVPTAPTADPGTNTTQLATTAFVLANGGGGTVFNLGSSLSGDITLALSNGTRQYCNLQTDTNFVAPSDGADMDVLDVGIAYTNTVLNLNFTNFQMSPEALAALPIALDQYKSYAFRAQRRGGYWVIVDFQGPTAETED